MEWVNDVKDSCRNVCLRRSCQCGPTRTRNVCAEHQLDKVILFGEHSLRKAIREFTVHYHQKRSHQGREDRIIGPVPGQVVTAGAVEKRERLGELPLPTRGL
jgi:hypothetical protein